MPAAARTARWPRSRPAPASAPHRRGAAGLLGVLRPDLEVVPLRGNVDTRLRKLDAGEADAIVLAAAGLVRLGLVSADRRSCSIRPSSCPRPARARWRCRCEAARRSWWRRSTIAPSHAARGRRARAGRGAGRRLHGAGGGARLARAGRAAGAVVGGARDRVPGRRRAGRPGAADGARAGAAGALRRAGLRPAGRPADRGAGAGLRRAGLRRQGAGPPRAHPGSDQRAAGRAGRPAFLRRAAEGRRSVHLRPRRRGGAGAGAGGHRLGGGARHLVGLRRARPTRASRSPSAGMAAQVTVVTGHEDPTKPESDLDWASLARDAGHAGVPDGRARASGERGPPDRAGHGRRNAGRGDRPAAPGPGSAR